MSNTATALVAPAATGVAPAGTPVGQQGVRVDVHERPAWQMNGWIAVGGFVLLIALALAAILTRNPLGVAAGSVLIVLAVVVTSSVCVVQPGQTRVVQMFGRYVGTVRTTGLVAVLPLTVRRNVSVRVRNFETERLKVNDQVGNPVEIATIVVWQVADTARAVFAVESYVDFVRMQAEAALRHVAGIHPYDGPDDVESLRGSTDVVSGELARELAERVAVPGLEIIEVRISHLAYAPEIAQAMLQRQQASAVVAARSRIVEGAVGMVEMALAELSRQQIVELDEERKAAMVSNLLVVLCGDSRATPVVNTGTLYQ